MAEQVKTVHGIPGIGTVHFPGTLSDEELATAVRKVQADAAADRGTQKFLASQFKPHRANFLEATGRGAMDVVDRLSQLNFAAGEALGIYPEGLGEAGTAVMNKEQAEFEKHNPGFSGGRLTGNVAATAPLALIPGGQTMGASAGYGALTGAAAGALQYDPSYTLRGGLANTAIGAGTGAITGPIAHLLAKGGTNAVEKMLGKFKGVMERTKGAADPEAIIREVPDFALLPKESRANLIIEAQEQIKNTGTLNVEQLARKANLIANDVTPTKSMVTRDPRDWSMERNLQKLSQSPDEQIAGYGQELTSVYQANDAALANRLRGFSANLPKGTQEAHGMAVMSSIDDLAKASQKDVSALYDAARAARGEELASDARKLFSELDDLADSPAADVVTEAAKRRLKKLGMIDAEGKLTQKTLTVKEAEGLRQFINQQPNAFGKSRLIRAIDEDVLGGLGEDVFKGARKAAQDRFAMLDNPVTQRALNAYGELTQGKTAQNFIKTQVVDAAEQDVGTLLNTLSKLPQQQADEALNSLKAGVLSHIESKSINPNSGQFSGAKINDVIRDIGEGKLIAVLGEKAFRELKSLARAATDATYQPPYAAVNYSNTAPTLLGLTQRARMIPGAPLVVSEAAERGAARAGYGNQLADVMAAHAQSLPPTLSPRVRSLVRLIQGSAAPAGATYVNERRNQDSK